MVEIESERCVLLRRRIHYQSSIHISSQRKRQSQHCNRGNCQINYQLEQELFYPLLKWCFSPHILSFYCSQVVISAWCHQSCRLSVLSIPFGFEFGSKASFRSHVSGRSEFGIRLQWKSGRQSLLDGSFGAGEISHHSKYDRVFIEKKKRSTGIWCETGQSKYLEIFLLTQSILISYFKKGQIWKSICNIDRRIRQGIKDHLWPSRFGWKWNFISNGIQSLQLENFGWRSSRRGMGSRQGKLCTAKWRIDFGRDFAVAPNGSWR